MISLNRDDIINMPIDKAYGTYSGGGTMEKYCISPDSTIIQCMGCMDKTGAGIALAVDEELKLIGTISDGDIRKALLKNGSLDSTVTHLINRNCFKVLPTIPRVKVLDMMQARRFEQVPIVDEKGKVIGIHFLHDMLGIVSSPNWAVIMAGGKGMRLRPLTENIPKPMIKVAGRPILERIILHLISYGINRIFLAVNYLSNMIEEHFRDGSQYGVSIEYLRENEPLGSGGALSLLPELPSHPLLVMNGDLIEDANFAKMVTFHTKNKFYATMGVYPYFHQVPFGCVEVENNKLSSLVEKPVLEETVNAGIYVLSPEAVSQVPKDIVFPITSLFEQALSTDTQCGAFVLEKEWLDIGSPQQLRQARGDLS